MAFAHTPTSPKIRSSWRPKATGGLSQAWWRLGLQHDQAKGKGGTPRPQPPQASVGSGAAEQQQWDWETASQSSGRSASSTKSAVHHALSLLAGVLALTNPVKPSRPCLHSAFSTLTPDPSRTPTAPPPQ